MRHVAMHSRPDGPPSNQGGRWLSDVADYPVYLPQLPSVRHLQDASDDTFDMDLQTVQDRRDLVRRHDSILNRSKRDLEKWDRYYEGDVPLKYMAPAISAEFGDRI